MTNYKSRLDLGPNIKRFACTYEHFYIISVVLAMGLLFFANGDVADYDQVQTAQGLGKVFYLPCGFALLLSFFIKKERNNASRVINLLIVSCLISSLFNPPVKFNFMTWGTTRFVLAILCFKDLRFVNPKLLLYYFAIAGPFIVIPHYILTNPFSYGIYRYAGYYGDPNFLAIALNFLITTSYVSTKIFRNNKIIKYYAITTIVGAVPLILAGMSRAGIMGLSIVLFYAFIDIYKSSKSTFGLIIILMFLMSGYFVTSLGGIIENVFARFSNESDSDAGGAYARIDCILSVLNVLTNRPYLIPFGIGPGNTLAMISEYRQAGYYVNMAVHNTYFGILYEMGAICAMSYVALIYKIFKNLYSHKMPIYWLLLIVTAFSLFTLPGTAFMPAWILFFFMSNNRIQELKI